MAIDGESIQADDFNDIYELEEGAPQKSEVSLSAEPLFAALLRDAVGDLWEGDQVMSEFVNYVAGPLSDRFGHVAAKGGEFVVERRARGKQVKEHYISDQSMRAHLINGLFPVLHVARILKEWNAPQFRDYDDATRRVYMAGFVLHDYLKLPGVEEKLTAAGFSFEKAVGAEQMPVLEAIFEEWCRILGLDVFLGAIGGTKPTLQDLIYIACNTQTRWGTLRNARLLPRLWLAPTQLDLAEQLSRLADLLAYIARKPYEAASDRKLHDEITTLSNGLARFTYHHLADNRGVLTNFIQNAASAKMNHEYRIPLLYAPSGVVYLEHRHKSLVVPNVSEVAEAAIERIKDVVGRSLATSRAGIKRDGKGMKYADYYWLFFDLPSFIHLGAKAIFDVIRENKTPSSGKRFKKMRDGEWMDPSFDLDLPDDLRVDQLAEWCYLAEKQVAEGSPGFDIDRFLLHTLGLNDLESDFKAVPRDNRAGGVGYHWYFAAGHYFKRHKGLDATEWRQRIEDTAIKLVSALRTTESSHQTKASLSDWDDLRAYIARILTFNGGRKAGEERATFSEELHRYSNAKRKGRGTTQVCALCSSPYHIDKQREAGVLFAPQVYSNKKQLHSSDAIRDICSICRMEMMLRQTLMNRSASSGGDFEGRRVRYLYFYPTYYFTPETLSIFRRAYLGIKRISFTELRKQLVDKKGNIDLSPKTLQRLEPLMLIPEEDVDPASDRYLRMHFPITEPVTFYFIGVPPPGRDSKDAEAWVHPSLLALLIPLCLDVKVVASESSLPIILEADEIAETVFLDGPHAAINYLTRGQTRINVDCILPVLQRLVTAYLIHLDGNSKVGSSGYDYRWQDLPALARRLSESSLYAFYYLKKWQRQQQLDSLPGTKALQYLNYLAFLDGGKDMSHARELTLLYRQFYRAKRYNSNSILRPVSLASKVILDAHPGLFDQEGLVEAVYGRLKSFAESSQREGLAYFPKGSNYESRDAAMCAFARYFVDDIFFKTFRGDKSSLRGKQLNLLKNACEVIYQAESARDRAEKEELERAKAEFAEA